MNVANIRTLSGMVRAELKRDAKRRDGEIAVLVGCSAEHVRVIRRELEDRGKIGVFRFTPPAAPRRPMLQQPPRRKMAESAMQRALDIASERPSMDPMDIAAAVGCSRHTAAKALELIRGGQAGVAFTRLVTERQVRAYRDAMRRELHLFEPHIVAAAAERGIVR